MDKSSNFKSSMPTTLEIGQTGHDFFRLNPEVLCDLRRKKIMKSAIFAVNLSIEI